MNRGNFYKKKTQQKLQNLTICGKISPKFNILKDFLCDPYNMLWLKMEISFVEKCVFCPVSVKKWRG